MLEHEEKLAEKKLNYPFGDAPHHVLNTMKEKEIK